MNLFTDGSSFGSISLPELAQSFLGTGSGRIGLPGFQRSAVWKPEKVEDLWDSLLCRFPIGSLLLGRYGDFSEAGYQLPQFHRSNPYPDTLVGEGGLGFIVIDGQQRLNAIALGFMPFQPGAAVRLWLDLAGPKDPSRRQFDFYLCTREQPFGAGLSKEEKKAALAAIQKDEAGDVELPLDQTYPYKARTPVPFYEFCQALQGQVLPGQVTWAVLKERLSNPDTVCLRGAAREHLQKKLEHPGLAQTVLPELVPAVLAVVSGGEYEIPLILVKKHATWMTSEKLGKLFERVNINGEVPPQAELFLSALKLCAPQVNHAIAAIYNDSQFGRLLSPTDLVLTALRLVDARLTSLQLDRFGKIVPASRDRLVELMAPQAGEPSPFQRCLGLAYTALHHTGSPGDIGLPRPFLAALRPRVWQTLTLWILANLARLETTGLDPADRLNMLRYAALDSLNYFLSRPGSLAAYTSSPAFATLSADALAGEVSFPALKIFQTLQRKMAQDGHACEFLTPSAYRAWLESGLLHNRLESRHLNGELQLLMYAQRDALVQWEPYPLELDPLLPPQWMSFKAGPIPLTHFWRVEGLDPQARYPLLNSPGNLRYWPASLTRLYHDAHPETKHIRRAPNEPLDHSHQKYHLHTVQDVLAASAIDPAQVQDWLALSAKGSRIWTTERFTAFRRLENDRRAWLYQALFDALQWQDWV